MPASVGIRLNGSPNLHDDFPFGSAHLNVSQRFPSLIERKHLVDYGPDPPLLERLGDLCKLATIRMHEQERILDASFPRVAIHLEAQQTQHEHHEKVHASRTTE